MLLFRSEEHIEGWMGQQKRLYGATMTLGTQWELAKAWYSDRSSPTWERRSLAATQELFDELGLVGAFWDLGV